MEARDITETLKTAIDEGLRLGDDEVETGWGFGDADFFLQWDDGTVMLVTVSKVSDGALR